MASLLGSHVESSKPLEGAELRGANVIQINLSAPLNWKKPREREDAGVLRGSKTPIFVHAPYLINPASTDEELRRKSIQSLKEQLEAATRIGARGLVVHGGHPTGAGTLRDAIKGWKEVLSQVGESQVPILIENTAGGGEAPARRLTSLEALWEELMNGNFNVGFCLDTCHAHAGGEELDGILQRFLSVTGRIDLIHFNDSKDPFDSRRDRHENIGKGKIPFEKLEEVLQEAQKLNVPLIVETPGGFKEQKEDLALLRTLITSFI